MEIRRVTEASVLEAAPEEFFDAPLTPRAVGQFLATPGQYLLYAYDDGAPVGMIVGSAVSTPERGTEMLLYDLGVIEAARRRGVGSALVTALAEIARAEGFRGMWVPVDHDNEAALATYRRAGSQEEDSCAVLAWSFEE